MKLLLLHQYFMFPDEKSGTRTYDLATQFLKHGIEVEVFTTTSDEKHKSKKRWKTIERDGLTVHYIYLPYSNTASYLSRAMVFLGFLWHSTFKLLAAKGDLVLATSTPLTIGIPALVKKIRHNTPFIFEVRDVWPEAVVAIGALRNKVLIKLLYALESRIYKNASAIIPLSDDMCASIVSRYPSLKDKPIKVIENIAVIDRFQNGYNPQHSVLTDTIGYQPRFTVLYAGTFGRVNGIEYVVRLAEMTLALDPTLVFVLIGDGAMKKDVEKEAREKGLLGKNMFLLNSRSKSDLPQLYYEASMGSSFVIDIPELGANSANKFFDTLAAARPVLINHKGWQENIITTKNIGYVLPAQLDKEDAEKFVAYTQNKSLQDEQQANALKQAKEAYSLDKAVSDYMEVISKLNENNV